MKTYFVKIICIVLFSGVTIFNAKSQDKLSQTLASIKDKVQEVKIDNTSIKQSIDVLDENKGKLSFVSVTVDEKGKTTKETFEFYVSDIDKNTIVRKTAGKKLFISLSVNNNQKFIKHFKEDKLDGYTNNLEILLSSADAAGELTNDFKTAIPLVKSGNKVWNTNTEALNWLKGNISKINSGTATFEQSFSFGERKEYLASFTVKKTDAKSVTSEEKYEFSLPDIDKKKLAVKINGTQLSVSVETNGNDRFIKCIKNNEQQTFDNNFEIVAEDIEQARNIIAAFSASIEKSKLVMPDFGTLQKSLDFIIKGTTDLSFEKKTVNQKINFIPGNGTKSIFTSVTPDSKGNPVEERYEFYLNDIDANSLTFKISGDRIAILPVTKDKIKLIKYIKDNNTEDFQNGISILTTDIEASREIVEAFKAAIKSSQTQPVIWKNTSDATNYLASTLKGETVGTDVYKLTFTPISSDPLEVRYVQDKTDSKGTTIEQTFEFYLYMLDPATVKISSSGKYLNVEASVNGKKSYLKVLKDGKQQAFEDVIKIMAFEARQAGEIAGAIKYLAGNSKPKDKTWADKQSAMNFIIGNISDPKSEGKELKQKIDLTNNDPCKISLTVTSIDDKGKTSDAVYEFSLSDMDKQLVEFKVEGKNVLVSLVCKNKEKLVKVYKNGVQQPWGTNVAIEVTDVEIAKNISGAFRSAITQCEK